MNEDLVVSPRSAKSIEARSLAWRHALNISDDWAPDVAEIIENSLPLFVSQFALVVAADREMDDAEAYTEFDPPRIVVRESVYTSARQHDPRARMTFAHEFGHLVLHAGVLAKPRMVTRNQTPFGLRPFESAEWQARKFAAYFLMPFHIVRSFTSPYELAESCKVSVQSAKIRIAEVGHLSSASKTPECVQTLKIDLNAGLKD